MAVLALRTKRCTVRLMCRLLSRSSSRLVRRRADQTVEPISPDKAEAFESAKAAIFVEAQALVRLKHDGIVGVFGVFEHQTAGVWRAGLAIERLPRTKLSLTAYRTKFSMR
jgi:hypothetical protein